MESDSINGIRSLREEVSRNRKEIKSAIEATETRLLMKVEELKEKVNHLEEENETSKSKVETSERYSKKNNIIIFGLNNRENTANTLSEKLNTLLEIDVRVPDFNNIYHLNNTEKPPVKVEFLSILRTYSNKAREKPADRFYIEGNEPYVNDRAYLKELEEMNHLEKRNANSAPPTPNLRNLEEKYDSSEEAAISIAQEDPKDINTPKTIGNKKNNKPIAGGPALKERKRSQRSNK
ncbi:hypothetical protein JTB14_032531 [Gonioctena quinquepunctata]|nr:hypothetical protein JTB14_032531 [Gonioctena quinquepunctata]